jgi:hypothetical protein
MDKNPNFEAAKRLRAKRRKALDDEWLRYIELRRATAPGDIDINGGLRDLDRHGKIVTINKPMSYEAFEILMGQDLRDLFGTTGE